MSPRIGRASTFEPISISDRLGPGVDTISCLVDDGANISDRFFSMDLITEEIVEYSLPDGIGEIEVLG